MKITRNIISGLAIVFVLGGCSSNKQDSDLPEVVRVPRVIPYHIVKEGETVGSISKEYSMKRADLIKMNTLQPPYQLYNGQRLVVIPKIDSSAIQDEQDIRVSENSADAPLHEQIEQNKEKDAKINEEDIEESEEVVEVAEEIKESDYEWPISDGAEKVSKHFGESDSGIVFAASAGTPVHAIADGVVMISGVPSGEAAAYGTTVVIKHSKLKKLSVYANLKEASVKVGAKVKKGGKIGLVGKSGVMAKTPQLYFEVNDISGKSRKPEDPEKLLGE